MRRGSGFCRRPACRLMGSDRDAGAIEAATGNAERAGVADDVEWRRAAISAVEPPPPGWVVTNPPYGGGSATARGSGISTRRWETSLRAKCPGMGGGDADGASGAGAPDRARARAAVQHGERRARVRLMRAGCG